MGKTTPISRLNVRSFTTSVQDGAQVKAGRDQRLRGIAFDSGHGISEVTVSFDGGTRARTVSLPW